MNSIVLLFVSSSCCRCPDDTDVNTRESEGLAVSSAACDSKIMTQSSASRNLSGIPPSEWSLKKQRVCFLFNQDRQTFGQGQKRLMPTGEDWQMPTAGIPGVTHQLISPELLLPAPRPAAAPGSLSQQSQLVTLGSTP